VATATPEAAPQQQRLAAVARSRPRTRAAGISLILAVVLAALAVVSLAIGRYAVPVGDVARILLAQVAPLERSWSETAEVIVVTVRLPRILLAILAGAALGASGAALQGVFRNPLVGPHIIGVSSGASFGGALALLLTTTLPFVVAGAFAFGLASLACVFALAHLVGSGASGGTSRTGSTLVLVLAGLIVSALFSALVGLIQFAADPETKLPLIVFWLLGSFATANSGKAAILAVFVLAAGAPLMGLRWRLNVLSLDEDEARSFGIRVEATRWFVLALVTLLVAAQVAVSGVIAWVGLAVPHLARMLVGADHRALLPASALLGGAFLLLVDDLARTLTSSEIPLGILTALVGAPAFALLLRKTQGRGWMRRG
jgi:iron complex transport system permease protein